MDTSTLIVVIVGTLLFVGIAVWGAFFAPRNAEEADNQSETK